jgi:hypothetical protein
MVGCGLCRHPDPAHGGEADHLFEHRLAAPAAHWSWSLPAGYPRGFDDEAAPQVVYNMISSSLFSDSPKLADAVVAARISSASTRYQPL